MNRRPLLHARHYWPIQCMTFRFLKLDWYRQKREEGGSNFLRSCFGLHGLHQCAPGATYLRIEEATVSAVRAFLKHLARCRQRWKTKRVLSPALPGQRKEAWTPGAPDNTAPQERKKMLNNRASRGKGAPLNFPGMWEGLAEAISDPLLPQVLLKTASIPNSPNSLTCLKST